jgi:hypothetical protein
MNPDTPRNPVARTLEERIAELEREVAGLRSPTRGTLSTSTGLILGGARTFCFIAQAFCFIACIGVVSGCIAMMATALNILPILPPEINSRRLWMLAGVGVMVALAGFLALCFFAALDIVLAQVGSWMRRESKGSQAPWKGSEPNKPLQPTGPAT